MHDYEHNGTTNAFHVNTESEVAMLYNDRAVLENHHASAALRLMKDEDFNIVSSLKPAEYREFRALVIEIVLATDMSFHFQQIKNVRSLLSMPENIDKCKALSLIVHCADISHPAKTWDMHQRWTDLLVQEFFRQGDREAELSLPISPLCDRNNTLVAESQIGFIDFIVEPSFQVMSDVIDKILEPMQPERQKQTPLNNTSSPYSKPSATQQDATKATQFRMTRHWLDCLLFNKKRWKEKAVTESEARNQRMEAAAAADGEKTLTDNKEDALTSSHHTFLPFDVTSATNNNAGETHGGDRQLCRSLHSSFDSLLLSD